MISRPVRPSAVLPLAILMLAAPFADASSFLVGRANVCFADRVGDKMRPAWNSFTGSDTMERPEAAPESSGPIQLVLPEDTVAEETGGLLELEISGLSLGQTVRIERFLVDNDEGVINENAVLMESHLVQDGYFPEIADIPNFNSVQDWDYELNGEIRTELGLFGGLANMGGEHVIRVSSPLGSFPPATARLTIIAAEGDQSFQGQVLDDEGEPVPFAFVGLLESQGFTSEIRGATRADENGAYTLHAPRVGEVHLVAVAPGHVGPYQVGNSRLIGESEILDHDITLTPGTVTLSGQVRHAETNEPIGGLPVTFQTMDDNDIVDGRLMTHVWTDNDGFFSVNVTPDRWNIIVKPFESASRNLLLPANEPLWIVDTRDGQDVTDLLYTFTTADALIAGGLRDEFGAPPFEPVQMIALNVETGQTSAAFTTDFFGVFTMPASPGLWQIIPSSFDLDTAGSAGITETWVRINGAGQAVVIDAVTSSSSANISGTFTRESDDTPVGGLLLWAQSVQNNVLHSVYQTTRNADGIFSAKLSAGDWFILPNPRQASSRQLLMRNLPRLTVEQNFFDLTEIDWEVAVVEPERKVRITIVDTGGNPVGNVPIHGHMEDGEGDNYDAFGYTDADGVAIIPAKTGHWHFHASSFNLRRAGMRAIPEVHAMVSSGSCGEEPDVCACAPQEIELTAVPFTGELPQVTSVRLENTVIGDEFGDEDEFEALIIEGTGEPGKLYEVEGSFDLESWYFVGQAITLDGSFTIIDPDYDFHELIVTDEEGSGKIFYRLVKRD